MIRRWLPIAASVCLALVSAPAQEKIEVVFLADFLYANNPTWVKHVKAWGATGINLRVYRSEVESEYHSYDFAFMRSCLRNIAGNGLDIHVRASMGLLRSSWKDRYTVDDFHQTKGGVLYDNYNVATPGTPILNVTSARARADLVRFFSAVVRELKAQPPAIRSKIKAVAATISPDDEFEFPSARHRESVSGGGFWGWLSGYSRPEREAFLRYLCRKYNASETNTDASRLNAAWGSSFPRIDGTSIALDAFDWETLKPVYQYYPAGRRDFVDFRTSELQRFADTCAAICHAAGFKFVLQFGSIYDQGIEAKGFFDVTPLCENADYLVNDDIPEYAGNFRYVADFQRSIARYWEYRRAGSPAARRGRIRFGTETNWPGYAQIRPNDLVYYWKEQVTSLVDRGGSVIYVSHWGTADGVAIWKEDAEPGKERERRYLVADLVIKEDLDKEGEKVTSPSYALWRTTLKSLAGRTPRTVEPATAIRLSHEQVWYGSNPRSGADYRRKGATHGGDIPTFDGKREGRIRSSEFPTTVHVRNVLSQHRSAAAVNDPVDIITDFMDAASPRFKERYRTVYR